MSIITPVLLATICTLAATDSTLAQNLFDVKVWDARNQKSVSAGTWVIGGTQGRLPLDLRLTSGDYGKTFGGAITYDRQAPGLGLKAVLITRNTLAVEAKGLSRIRGASGDAWAKDGNWVIGQPDQIVVQMDARSRDSGKSLEGNVTFLGSKSVRFSAALVGALTSSNPGKTVPVAGARLPVGAPSAPVREAAKLPITAGTAFKKGMKYPSPSGNYTVFFQDDGNLIVTSKDGKYVWGLDQVAKNLSRSSHAEIKPDGSFGVYENKGGVVWTATGKRDPKARLNLTYDGVLQMTAPSGEILWASDGVLTPSLKSFLTKANVKPSTPDPGWSKCIEMVDPKIKIMGTAAVSPSAMNAVANIYTEMTKRLRPTPGNPNPKRNFDGFKVYMTNGEPWPVLSKMSTVGTMWKDQTGPKSGEFLRGGASNDFVWISEQMIAKQGVKTRNDAGTPDNTMRTFDQVVHEFAHSIDFQLIPDSVVNRFTGNGTPVESFAFRVQQWFGVPGGSIPPAEEAELNKIFSSRASFSTEGYKP